MKLSEIVSAIRASKLTAISINVDMSAAENISGLDDLAKLISESDLITDVFLGRTNLGKFPMGNSMAVASLVGVFEAVGSRSGELKLDLVSNDLGHAVDLCAAIFPVIMRSKSVVSLNLSDNNLYLLLGQLDRIFQSVRNEDLRGLNLSYNHFGLGERGQLPLLWDKVLRYCSSLKQLYLYDNELGKSKDAVCFLKSLHGLNLMQLSLSGNDLGDLVETIDCDDITPLVQALTEHPTLESLDLSNNLLSEFGASDLEIFFEGVLASRRIRELDIDVNQLSIVQKYQPEFKVCFKGFIEQTRAAGLKVNYKRGNFDSIDSNGQQVMFEEEITPRSKSPCVFFQEHKADPPSATIINAAVKVLSRVAHSDEAAKRIFSRPDFWRILEDPKLAQSFCRELGSCFVVVSMGQEIKKQ